MFGLTYIRKLFDKSMDEVAGKLDVSKQTISKWENKKIPISKDRLKQLSEMFGIDEEYFYKELEEIDKLFIQKEKIKRELHPQVVGKETYYEIGENDNLEERSVYDSKAFNEIEIEIDKEMIIDDFKQIICKVNKSIDLDIFKQINLLLKKAHGQYTIFQYTIDAVSHYYNVLPDWVGEPESIEFVEEFLKLAKKYEDK